MAYIQIKSGDTLTLPCTDDTIDLSGVTITSAVESGNFYELLTVSNIDAGAGTYTLSAEDTSNWPLGTLDCDIKYVGTTPSYISHSATFQIVVTPEVTR